MKTKILGKYILIVLVVFSMFACGSDFLDEVNPNTSTEDTYWQTEADAEAALATIYSPIRGQMYGYWGAFTGFQNQNVRGDDLLPVYDDPQTWAITDFTNDANNPRVGYDNGGGDWELLYLGINRSNNFLVNIDRVEMDDNTKEEMKGEAYFLRAWNYFMLVINWGDIPLRLTPVSSVEETMAPSASEAEIWVQIESDLKEAKSRLPITRPEGELGRIIKDAAIAYLGKAYVYQGKFNEAKTELLEIKNSGRHGLIDNPDENYTETNEFNKESIFEINYYQHGTGGVWGNDGSDTPQVNILANFVGAPPGGWYKLQPSESIIDEFTKEERPAGSDSRWDKRMYTNFFFKYSDYNDVRPDETWYGSQEVTMDDLWKNTETKRIGNNGINKPNYSDIDGKSGRFIIKKFTAFWSSNGDSMYNTEKHTNNIRVMRYAEVLLLLAEAAAKTGDVALANECITTIRDRAGLAKKTFSGDAIMDEIEHQRLLEFFLEGQRFYDLKRWYTPEQVKQIFIERGKVGVANFQPKHFYYPIPQGEINANTAIEQHPLWK